MTTRIQIWLFIVFSALCVVLFAPSRPVQASSCSWTGNKNTDWADVQNWSCGHIPTNADDVTIPSGSTYPPSITNPAQVGHLTPSFLRAAGKLQIARN
jgi:hypothetical protein